ncbi:helix-turn-helix transcriptional regulator [Leucobacter weissii]|uniref:Helix-turn-helix transcriptional regulator n=1 Tax=Leucobacter weissii TaxID=1983706 RepID=A0A939MJ61_9MICO|nr:helix-turn-helix domain-containing protein [Leucobacter weissii]MBO1901919.1 helix-turn-helix transcriptional regulator [Leucobacter weissii]
MASITAIDPSTNAFDGDCTGRIVLDQLTSRWGFLILVALRDGEHRFFELRNRIHGVSEKMLSQTLRGLTGSGLVERHVIPTVPPAVSYTLTDLGRSAAEPLAGVFDWLSDHAAEIAEHQQ